MSESKKRAYETSSEEDTVLASKGSAAAIKRNKVPSQKFLPAYHEAYPWFLRGKASNLFFAPLADQTFIMQAWQSI